MVSVLRPPVPALTPFVDVVFYVDDPTLWGREVGIPTGAMQLAVNLREDVMRWYDGDGLRTQHRTAGCVMCTATARPVGIDTADQQLCVGAAFRPGGAVPFFDPPAGALTEPVIGLDTLWGRDGPRLRERLLEQPTADDALQALERALLDRIVRADHTGGRAGGAAVPRGAARQVAATQVAVPDPAVEYAVSALSNGAAVGRVAERLGLTATSFQRRFRAAVGLSPKPFGRVQRLQRVLRALNATPDAETASAGGANGADTQPMGPVDWAGVAADFGYFDQSHLIHEFHALTGGTPTEYRPRSAAEHNHVPIEAGG